jgi:hypothetical protein
VIFAHNHPSGVAEPSHADEMLTQCLKQALALVDVKVLDHFVVAGSGTCRSQNAVCCSRCSAAIGDASPVTIRSGATRVVPQCGPE